jgi:hypothetical protein
MSVGMFMKSGGWAALAVALAVSVGPADASAQGRARAERMTQEREGGDRADSGQRNAMEIRGQRVQQANEARTRQPEQRAAPAERPVERPVAQGERQVTWQGDRRSDRAARPAEQRSAPATRQGEQRTSQARQGERNASYADQGRNRDYSARNGNGRGVATRGDDRRDNDPDGSWQGDRRDNDRSANTWQGGRRDNDWNNRSWDRRWRDNNRYDWQRYRNANRTAYRVGTYSAPYRYYTYRRYGIGSQLGSLFYGSRYWISNPWQYRLPEVWGPYRWVRYYDDVLLVDVYTGQVVDVIHNFFW